MGDRRVGTRAATAQQREELDKLEESLAHIPEERKEKKGAATKTRPGLAAADPEDDAVGALVALPADGIAHDCIFALGQPNLALRRQPSRLGSGHAPRAGS